MATKTCNLCGKVFDSLSTYELHRVTETNGIGGYVRKKTKCLRDSQLRLIGLREIDGIYQEDTHQ